MGARGRPPRRRDSTGAAAVEFALLVPVFVMLAFGMFSGAVVAWQKIEVTQAARDAARFGSTYPIGDTTDLQPVADVAARQAGWASLAEVPTVDNGVVCVALITPSGNLRLTSGTWAGASGSRCFDDGSRSDSRVQVYIQRTGEVDAVLYRGTPVLRSGTTMPYERLL